MGQAGEITGLTLELPSFPTTRNTTQANTMKSFGRHWATALVLAAMLSSVRPDSSGSTHTAYSLFSDSACTKATYVDFSMDSNDDSNCEDQGCNEAEVGGLFYTYSCVPDYSEFASSSFGESPYLVVQTHTDKSCTADSSVRIYLADGKCHVSGGLTWTCQLQRRMECES
ncbi:hypothetical protein PF010_g22935 [Phytophthora fragariae]|uniref:Uncharacterized protein n=1 Tax=Phytophthora fragariae TaxID=53985 RepID=A0A6G0K757_9STRA|nr:hypothetical protein PF010_g22935 [Phytophthora fragariae]